MKFTYYLDGKEIKPDDLAGKSGKLKIKVDYTNNTKTTVDINGKKETMYTPFVLMTGMILPQDTSPMSRSTMVKSFPMEAETS